MNKIDILLVEDNEFEAKLALRSLKKNNLTDHLLHLNDGEKASDYIFATGSYQDRDLSDNPQMILLDINLPKVSGMEILEMIKNDARTMSIPVILLTSSKESSDIKKGYDRGANGYIVKPLDYESLSKVTTELGIEIAI